ncbi:hypothetical protein KAR91_77860 [Candidatus Pacearchaeota archaeon]|nr:hypothetical protein [Candidatus Pacearchaeota archaeon]
MAADKDRLMEESKVSPENIRTILLDDTVREMKEFNRQMKQLIEINSLALNINLLPNTFVKSYQFKTVKAGGKDTIFLINIPQDEVGIITTVANSWFIDTSLEWKVDDRLVEHVPIQRVVAPLNNPLQVRIPVEDTIEWIANNDSTNDHVFEVVCNGFLIDEKLYKRILTILP